jgi:hypothetical protein
VSTDSITSTQRNPGKGRRNWIIAGLATLAAAVVATVALSGAGSALLGSTTNGSAEVTFADQSQTVYTNGAAGVLNPTWNGLVPGAQVSQNIGIANGDVPAKFVLQVTPPASASISADQLNGLKVGVTDNDTGDTVVAPVAFTDPSLAAGLNLGNLAAGQSRTFKVTLYEASTVTTGGGSITTGLQLVATQVV